MEFLICWPSKSSTHSHSVSSYFMSIPYRLAFPRSGKPQFWNLQKKSLKSACRVKRIFLIWGTMPIGNGPLFPLVSTSLINWFMGNRQRSSISEETSTFISSHWSTLMGMSTAQSLPECGGKPDPITQTQIARESTQIETGTTSLEVRIL